MMRQNKLFSGLNSSNKIAAMSVADYSIAGFFNFPANIDKVVSKSNKMFLFEAKKKINVNFEGQSPRNFTVEKLGSLNNIKGGEGLGHKKRISRNWRGIDCFKARIRNGFKYIVILTKLLYLKASNALLNNLSKKYFFSPYELQLCSENWDNCRSNKLLIN